MKTKPYSNKSVIQFSKNWPEMEAQLKDTQWKIRRLQERQAALEAKISLGRKVQLVYKGVAIGGDEWFFYAVAEDNSRRGTIYRNVKTQRFSVTTGYSSILYPKTQTFVLGYATEAEARERILDWIVEGKRPE